MGLPPKSKQGSGDDSASNQDSGTGRQEAPKGFFSADALDVCGGLIFLVVGAGFHIAGGWFHIIGFTFDFLVVCCGLTVITHHVDEQTFKRFGLRYWISVIVAFIIFASLSAYVPLKENSQPLPTNTAEWQPPELPEGTKTAYLSIGDAHWTIDLKKITPNHPFIPPEWGANPITVVLKNNRLYVQCDIDIFTATTNFMSTELLDGPRVVDEQAGFYVDRNFSPTVFEVVNQDTNPILQVIYYHPNSIEINGVFVAERPDGRGATDPNGHGMLDFVTHPPPTPLFTI